MSRTPNLYVHPYGANNPPVAQASDITYNNTHSGLEADNVQSAIDALSATKQNQLIAGANISIVGNTISATGAITAEYDSEEEDLSIR